ncbi:hypothetical protein Z517_03282 [Fonsecaea pedrosoi CBS 271.37]|uniref:YCII-related domain-containing protein n=1 Tax=Fonsecaea pedrosoi CBS 271.37 TaxID=1442368 RepID=A0A0D2E1Z4_9EURO|nr:uncharacterized protein Z517_03282 [Fonsecaea pedrosoi CBS 271.37]KIW84036.1 hypothetical protein Z517_03282 [Fonsecaea pedrosoi CBS 271.37]
MATAPPQKSEWLIVVHDLPDTADRRRELLPKHGEDRKNDPAGFWVFGGALLDEPALAGKPISMTGSCMLAYAESKEEILERLERDVLVTGKVWDWEKLQVYPFWRPARPSI